MLPKSDDECYDKITYRKRTYLIDFEDLLNLLAGEEADNMDYFLGDENCYYGPCSNCTYKPDKSLTWTSWDSDMRRCVINDKLIKKSLINGNFNRFIVN